MKIEISNHLVLTEIPDRIRQRLMTKLTFPNPAYADAVKMNRWTGNLDRELCIYQAKEHGGLIIPRGCFDSVKLAVRQAGESVQVEDHRRTLPEVDFTFAGTLKPFQDIAVQDMLRHDEGVLGAPTGSGKTVMALAIVAEHRQPTLIIVHNKELLNQWIDRIETFLDIPRAEIGQIGAGKKIIGKRITVGIVNSIYPHASLIKHLIGHLIIDECHQAPSRTFTEAVTAFDCRYILGLSATPYRRDGLSKLIYWHLGDRRHQVDRNALQEAWDIVPAEVFIRYTKFITRRDPSAEYSKMLSELTEDCSRNSLIAADVVRAASNGGGACLVLTDRREHAETLWAFVMRQGIKADVLTGELSARDREEIIGRLNAGSVPVVIATGQLVGEGFDCKCLTTLFMATPLSYHGRVIQYLGRVLRPAPGKEKARVYDYADENIGVLRASAIKRRAIYIQNQWKIMS